MSHLVNDNIDEAAILIHRIQIGRIKPHDSFAGKSARISEFGGPGFAKLSIHAIQICPFSVNFEFQRITISIAEDDLLPAVFGDIEDFAHGFLQTSNEIQFEVEIGLGRILIENIECPTKQCPTITVCRIFDFQSPDSIRVLSLKCLQ